MSVYTDNIGPITSDVTYIPVYDKNKYNIVYVTNNESCTNVNSPASSTTSARSYLYTYGDTVKNNVGSGFDVRCSKDGKTFIGWARTANATDIPVITATGNMNLYPIFMDKTPISVYVNSQQIGTMNVDAGTTAAAMRSLVQNLINTSNASQSYSISISTSMPLYKDSRCSTTYGERDVPTTAVYVKGDPYITFNNSDGWFADNTTINSKKIKLSELSSSSARTPRVVNRDQNMLFVNWTLASTNNSSNPYPSTLGADTLQLANYTNDYPATYQAKWALRTYKVVFKDAENNCSPAGGIELDIPHNTKVSKSGYADFKNLTCNKAGHTWKGWTKESYTPYPKSNCNSCPRCPLNLILIVVVLIFMFYYIYSLINYVFNHDKPTGTVQNSTTTQ